MPLRYILILASLLLASVCHSDDQDSRLLKDHYFVITLPKIRDPKNCFPQSFVPASFIDGKIAVSEIEKTTTRKPWESEGLIVFMFNEKCGYCDANGTIIIPPVHDSRNPFSQGLCSVINDKKFYYIDKTGHTVAGPFEFAHDFSDGVGAVKFNNLWGFVDAEGKWVMPPTFERIDLCVGGYEGYAANGEKGFVNNRGVFIKDGELGHYYQPPK
jgi:hypothetical protein